MLLEFLGDLSENHEVTKMTVENLAVRVKLMWTMGGNATALLLVELTVFVQLVFAPNIIRPEKHTMETSLASPYVNQVMTFLIHNRTRIWHAIPSLAEAEGL